MFIDTFLKYLRFERNYSEKTIVSYRIDLEEFEDYLKKVDAEKNLVTADADLVRSWMVYLMEKGRSVATVNRKLSSLRSFYRFLLRRRVVDLDPMLKVVGPKKQKTLPSFLRVQEMDRLLDECSVNEGFEGVRDRLILEMFYATGMRLSELIGLSDADVDLSAKLLKVTGKRNKQRLIPFGEELWRDLLGYIELRNETLPDRDDALFVRKDGKRMYPELVYKIVRRNLSKVATLKKRSPHVLRHTFATAMLNGNAELQAVKELLGHESLATTEIYTHSTFVELKKLYEHAHPRA